MKLNISHIQRAPDGQTVGLGPASGLDNENEGGSNNEQASVAKVSERAGSEIDSDEEDSNEEHYDDDGSVTLHASFMSFAID